MGRGCDRASHRLVEAAAAAPCRFNLCSVAERRQDDRSDVARGTQLLRLASNLAPKQSEIRLHLGRALLKSGDKEAARRALDPLTKLDSASPLRVDAEKALAGN